MREPAADSNAAALRPSGESLVQPPHHVSRPMGVALLALVALAGAGCWGGGPTEPTCGPQPVPGAVTLTSEACVHSLGESWVPLALRNDTAERIWFFHDCADEVPWLSRLEADGTWRRLLPEGFSLPLSCEHVHDLMPGTAEAQLASTLRAPGPGTYRAEMVIAWGCGDIHDPHHVLHSCERVEYLSSAPFELR
jgi:hypothetical protein